MGATRLTEQTAGGKMRLPLGRGRSALAGCLCYNQTRTPSSALATASTSAERMLATAGAALRSGPR